jgi:hypothetical protein
MADMTQLDRVALMPLWAFLLTLGLDCKLVPEEFRAGGPVKRYYSCMTSQLLGIIELFKLIGNDNTFSRSDGSYPWNRGDIFK